MDGWKMSFLLGNPIFRCELLVSGRVYFWFQTSKWHLTAFVEVTSATVLNSHREIHHNVTEQLSAQELVAWTWVKNSILRVSLGQGLWFQMETKDCTQTIIGEAKKVMLTAIWVFFRTGMGALITSHFLAWNASHSNFHTLFVHLLVETQHFLVASFSNEWFSTSFDWSCNLPGNGKPTAFEACQILGILAALDKTLLEDDVHDDDVLLLMIMITMTLTMLMMIIIA